MFTGTEDDPKSFELWRGYLDYKDEEYLFGKASLIITKNGEVYTIDVTATVYTSIEDNPSLPDLTKAWKEVSATYS
jgi:hypothetical protein